MGGNAPKERSVELDFNPRTWRQGAADEDKGDVEFFAGPRRRRAQLRPCLPASLLGPPLDAVDALRAQHPLLDPMHGPTLTAIDSLSENVLSTVIDLHFMERKPYV